MILTRRSEPLPIIVQADWQENEGRRMGFILLPSLMRFFLGPLPQAKARAGRTVRFLGAGEFDLAVGFTFG